MYSFLSKNYLVPFFRNSNQIITQLTKKIYTAKKKLNKFRLKSMQIFWLFLKIQKRTNKNKLSKLWGHLSKKAALLFLLLSLTPITLIFF